MVRVLHIEMRASFSQHRMIVLALVFLVILSACGETSEADSDSGAAGSTSTVSSSAGDEPAVTSTSPSSTMSTAVPELPMLESSTSVVTVQSSQPELLEASCSEDAVTAFLTRFLKAFNEGDHESLKTMFPDVSSGSQIATGDIDVFQTFHVNAEVGPSYGADNRDDLMEQFSERHAQHETLQLTALTVYPRRQETVTFQLELSRKADDVPEQTLIGKGRLNCAEQWVLEWRAGQAPETS